MSFSKIWSVSSSNKFLTSANVLKVLRFRGGNIGTWLGLMRGNTEGGSLTLFLPQASFVGWFSGQCFSHTTVILMSGLLALGIIVSQLSLSSKFIGNL